MFEREWESKREEHAEPEAPARQRPPAIIQAKLTVGAANDPFEREADRVADSVMRVLGRAGAAANMPATDGLDPTSISRHAGHAGHDHGPAEVGFAGGSISDELSTRIRSSSGGRPLDDSVRQRMESGFGADFSAVRIHANSALPARIAADAFTVGRSIHFAEGRYDPSSSAGQHLLAHELTHVVQQGGAVARHVSDHDHSCTAACASTVAEDISIADVGYAVRRHSSWEHMMIGDLDPKSLATVGAYKDVQLTPNTPINVGNDIHGNPVNVTATDIKHVIQQEVQRLKYFQAAPPMVTSYADVGRRERQLKAQDAQDTYDNELNAPGGSVASAQAKQAANQWDLKLVGVPNRSGQIFLVTYGEMNTLGDYFGSIEEMQKVDPKWMGKLIRGVRESALRELTKIYAEVSGFTFGLAGTAEGQARAELGVTDEKFRSAHGKDNAVDLGGVTNELKLMGAVPSGFAKPAVGGDQSTDYSSTLARNACHFAPESWHAWAGYHEKGRTLALEAFNMRLRLNAKKASRQQTAVLGPQSDFAAADAREEERIAEKINMAMLNNGFGDHYLQDSYAAGHLINKTRIMQQYVKWLDANPDKWDAHRNKNWRRIQQMAYNQPGLTDAGQYNKANVGAARQTSSGKALESGRNPQTSENVKGTWKDKAEALGLQVPDSIGDPNAKELLVHWQTVCVNQLKVRNPRVQTWGTVRGWATSPPISMSGADALAAIQMLWNDGIVRFEDYSTSDWTGGNHTLTPKTKLTLRDEYVPSSKKKLRSVTTGNNADAKYSDMALGVAYNDYVEFMNSSFLQKSTNFIHNEFCENGLEVTSGANDPVFTVYGDDNMFKLNAGEGLMHSGVTARMSRDAITTIADTGASAVTTGDILDRLPAYVRVGNVNTPLANWGDDLGGQLDNLFDKMSDAGNVVINKTVVGVKGSLGVISNTLPKGHEVF
jgi:hypothetical protein